MQRGERFRTTPVMRAAYWVVQFPPLYAAVILLLPPPTFGTSSAYALMAALATERTWAILSGIIPLVALGAWFSRRAACIHCACMLTSGWHAIIAVMFLLAEPLAVSPGAMLAVAILAQMLAARI